MKWWADNNLQDWMDHAQTPTPGLLPMQGLWPVQVRGQQIGTCRGIVDLVIDAGAQMTVWAFSSSGVAKVWQIDDGSWDGRIRRSFVVRDGTIRDEDVTGDVEMVDAASVGTAMSSPKSSSPKRKWSSPQQESFDGTISRRPSLPVNESPDLKTMRYNDVNDRDSVAEYVNSVDADVDADGDVLMDDLVPDYDPEERISEFRSDDSFEEVALATTCTSQVLYRTSRWQERAYVGETDRNGRDLVDELTGIARIDVEIR